MSRAMALKHTSPGAMARTGAQGFSRNARINSPQITSAPYPSQYRAEHFHTRRPPTCHLLPRAKGGAQAARPPGTGADA